MRASIFLLSSLLLVACGEGRMASCPDGGCPGTSDGPGPAQASNDDAGPSCGRYLSCLLLTTPNAYAGALVLYGKDSACWASPQQATGCEQACDSAFAYIAGRCDCEGTTCTLCPDLAGGFHSTGGQYDCSDSGYFPYDSMRLTANGTSLSVELEYWNGDGSYTLTGERACTSAFTVTGQTGSNSPFDCLNERRATLTPDPSGDRIQLAYSMTSTCYGEPPSTCTGSASFERN